MLNRLTLDLTISAMCRYLDGAKRGDSIEIIAICLNVKPSAVYAWLNPSGKIPASTVRWLERVLKDMESLRDIPEYPGQH